MGVARTLSDAQTSALDDVELCSKRAAAARADFERAVAVALGSGCSLREIADRTDSSHMSVRRLIVRFAKAAISDPARSPWPDRSDGSFTQRVRSWL